MLTHFPQAVPEIPVSNVDNAAEYYVNVLGFSFDWGNDDGGIGGISQGKCRMFYDFNGELSEERRLDRARHRA